jgi:hypothetical protein
MNNRDPRDEIDDQEVLEGEIVEPIGMGTLAVLQKVEIDQQVATAKLYPRNVPQLKKELTALVTMDEDTADDCIYALPRGQKHIKGPSARFADALISYWGNARSGAYITQVDKEEKFVEAIGSFQDVERNVIRQRRVRRPISDRSGRLYNADMINMTGNAACVIAERNAILNGIPKSLWSGAYEQAFALVAGTVKTLGEKLARAEKAFNVMGISMDQVLEKLEKPDISKIVPDDIVTMRGMLTALKTGEETVETIFGRGAGHAHETVKSPLKDDPNISTGKPQRGTMENLQEANRIDEATRKELQRGAGGEQQVDSGGKSSPNPPEDNENAGADHEETASSNRTPREPAAEKPADEGAGGPAPDRGQGGKTAQASPTSPARAQKPYTDGDSYIAWMKDQLDTAGSKSAATDVWGASRADRSELCTPEQIDELTKYKATKLAALKPKGE